MKTVKELKDYLQQVIDNLEWDYEDDDELNVATNTYFIHGTSFLATREGFVDLDTPCGYED